MKTPKEILNTIAANSGHKDWLELTHYEGPITILNCTIEAMELYAELSKSHIPVVGGPGSDVRSEGEQLPAEGQAQNGRVEKCNCRYPKYNGYTCSNCDLPY